MRAPLRTPALEFCGECGTRLPRNARGCPGCGVLIARPERPVAVIVFVAICALSAAFIAYSLAFNSGTGTPKPPVVLTLTELNVSVPPGWRYRDLAGAFVMAVHEEDLEVEEPDELRGPQLRITRERQARTNTQREVQRAVQQGDIAGDVKDATYGQASELIGSEVRFVRENLAGDLVGYRYYMTGSNPLGQAYVIAYHVPAELEQRYEKVLKTFLESLSLLEEESE